MEDLISREQAIKATWQDTGYTDPFNVMTAIRDRIKQLPPIQPEIVRCKDCDWWTKQDDSLQGRCALMGMYPTGEWFCGNAKRREVTT